MEPAGYADVVAKQMSNGYLRVEFPANCPECNGPLAPSHAVIDDFPYTHADVNIHCLNCKFKALYGIPLDKLSGTSLQIFDSNPTEVLKRVNGVETPVCPFHKTQMVLTKVFGDRVFSNNKIRVQYKCSTCFLTAHRNVTE